MLIFTLLRLRCFRVLSRSLHRPRSETVIQFTPYMGLSTGVQIFALQLEIPTIEYLEETLPTFGPNNLPMWPKHKDEIPGWEFYLLETGIENRMSRRALALAVTIRNSVAVQLMIS